MTPNEAAEQLVAPFPKAFEAVRQHKVAYAEEVINAAIATATAELREQRNSMHSVMLRTASHLTPIRDANNEQQHANDMAATMERISELDEIANSRVCDLECQVAQAESQLAAAEKRADWAELLWRARDKSVWSTSRLDDEPGVYVIRGDKFFPLNLDANGLPIETPELRAALTAALAKGAE